MNLKNYPIILQDDPSSCGSSCIAMILKYYGYDIELSDIKKVSRKTSNGISIKGMLNCFAHYHVEAKAYECPIDLLIENKLPCILFTQNGELSHFMVLYKIEKDQYILGDPARGLVHLSYEALNEIYLSRIILVTHVGRIQNEIYLSYKQYLYDTYQAYKDIINKIILQSIFISLITYISSYLYSLLIDHLNISTSIIIVIVVVTGYLLFKILESRLKYVQVMLKTKLSVIFNEDIVHDSSQNLLDQPFQYFNNGEGIIHSRLLSLFEFSNSLVEIYSTFLYSVIVCVILFIGLCLISVKLSLIVLAMLMGCTLLSYFLLTKIKDDHKKTLESYYQYASHLLSGLRHQLFIKTNHLNERINNKNKDLIDDYHSHFEKEMQDQNLFNFTLQLVIYIFYSLIMFVGIISYQSLSVTLGHLVMYLMIISLLIEPLLSIIHTVIYYNYNMTLFNTYKEFKNDYKEKKVLDEKITSITLDNLGYSYGYTKNIFDHLDGSYDNFTLVKGDNGKGKSTLLKLILGYDLNYTGDIYINSTSLKEIDSDSLYQHIGYLNETPSFIKDTLLHNFLTDDSNLVISFLKTFKLDELTDKLEMTIDEEGLPLSLGQRQLVAFIRLLISQKDVYLLDECFTHLDSTHYKLVMDYIKKESKLIFMVNHQYKSKAQYDIIDLNEIF